MQVVQICFRRRRRRLHRPARHSRIRRLTFFFSRFRFFLPVVGVASLSLASLSRHWRLLVIVVVNLLSLSLASRRRHWRLVFVDVLSLAAVVFLLVAASVGFGASSSFLSLAFLRRRWRCIVVVCGGVPPLGCFHMLWGIIVVFVFGVLFLSLLSPYLRRRLFFVVFVNFSLSFLTSRRRFRRLVLVTVLLLLLAVSLLVVASVGLFALLSLFPLEFRRRRWCLLVVGVIGISLSFAASRCRWRCLILVTVSLLSTEASLLVAASVGFCGSFLLLLLASPCCRRRIVVALFFGFLLLLLSAASHSCRRRRRRGILCKSLLYTRLTMHATTMDPQHQAQNVTVAISGVWRLDLVWPSPQNSSYER